MPSDPGTIFMIVQSSGFFSNEEISLARELAEEKVEQGSLCSYQFLFAEDKIRIAPPLCISAEELSTAIKNIQLSIDQAIQ